MGDVTAMTDKQLANSLRLWAKDVEDDKWTRPANLMRAAADRLERQDRPSIAASEVEHG